jgi:hypothetical protein
MSATAEKVRTLSVRFHVKTQGGEDVYRVSPLPVDRKAFRAAWRFEKLSDDGRRVTAGYDVSLDLLGYFSCECLSHLRWGDRRPCKHVAGIMAFVGHR